MMINVIKGSTPRMFNAMLFPTATVETQEWLDEQWNRDNSMLTDIGRQFMNTATEYWNKIYDPNLQRRIRSIARSVSGMVHPNQIVNLDTIEAIQRAKPIMQRYIMAEPTYRRLFHKQLCDGYSDSYVDNEPGLVGKDHYDWRRVMNGIVQDHVHEDGTEGWSFTQWHEDLLVDDRELEKDEQFTILNAHELVRAAIGRKIDPCDIFNGKLEI